MLSATMNAKTKRSNSAENGGGVVDATIMSSVRNGEDVSPLVRLAFDTGKPEVLLNQLKHVVKKKEVEIEELCKLHYEEFILAVDELRGVLVDADELKSSLSSENIRLQQIASSLLLKLEELLESYSIKKNITEAIKTLKVCVQVLNLCSKCNAHISNGEFHPALKIFDVIEKSYLQTIPAKTIGKVIEKHIPAIKSYIEKKVCSEFNDWLVNIRSSAKEIGKLAIGQATSARQRDEELRSRQREAEEQSRLGSCDCVYALDTELVDEESVLKFDLTPVYRAYHIYSCLGIPDRFRSYYYDNRLMQLNLDMQISLAQSFLESHQTFFSHIAGHFVVEDRVLRTAGGLLSDTQVEMMWDAAVTKITSILEGQFSQMDNANHILLVKDNVTLLAATLRQFRYRVSSLIDILDNSRDKYHELLLAECKRLITEALTNDSYKQMVIKKEFEYKLNVLSLNLQATDVIPDFPYVPPFSSSVPDICRIVQSFMADSVSYLSYGGDMSLYDVVVKYLNKVLINVLNEALLKTMQSGSLGVSQAMQMAANISVLEDVCPLFFHHAAQLCGIPIRLADRSHVSSNAKAVFKVSQGVAYGELLSVVNSKADEFLNLTENINWIADEAPPNGNEYIQEVNIYLDSLFSTALQILPLDALYKVGTGVLQHISDSIVLAFLSESVKRFTLSCVIGIDTDLKKLEIFADERFESTGLSDLKKECTLRDCLVEARQLVNLLMSPQPENFVNPVIRERNYGVLDYRKIATICDKFKDSPDTLFGSLSNRNSKQNARKKSMDMLRKRLREFN